MVKTILDIVIKVVDSVPWLKGYRTFIVLAGMGVVAGLDAFGVTHGWYATISPYGWPLATVFGLAHR